MAKQFALLECTTPQYFRGYHDVVIAVAVVGKVTNSDIADSIEQELTGEETPEYEALVDAYINTLRETLDEVFYQGDDLDEDAEETDVCYFSVINPRTINVIGKPITFLS